MANATCSVDGCAGKHYARTWCRIHYARWRKTGSLDLGTRRAPAKPRRPCTIDGCTRRHKAQGLCGTHYYRLRTNGDPLKTQIRPRTGRRSCSRCERTPAEVAFRLDKRAPDGIGAYCKPCEQTYNRSYYAANSVGLLVENRARYQRNRERYLAQFKAYRLANIERIRERDRQRSRGNPAKIEYSRRWRMNNPERAREAVRAWVAANPDRLREVQKAWRQRNPDRVADMCARRSARKRGADGRIELIDRRAVWVRDRGLCGLCAKPVPLRRMHLDHIKPLACGGPHTSANVQPTHPRCNQRKGAKEVPRWAYATSFAATPARVPTSGSRN